MVLEALSKSLAQSLWGAARENTKRAINCNRHFFAEPLNMDELGAGMSAQTAMQNSTLHISCHTAKVMVRQAETLLTYGLRLSVQQLKRRLNQCLTINGVQATNPNGAITEQSLLEEMEKSIR